MNLTARIHKVFDTGTVKAIASVNIGEDFTVHGVKVLTGTKSDSVVMPSTKYKDKYQDTFHPINREAREQINGVVMDAYQQYLSQGSPQSEPENMAQAM